MRYPSRCSRSLGALGLVLAALLVISGPALAQIGAGALTGTNTYEGREEGETIGIDLERGTFDKSLPFDVTFKIAGQMPPGFGSGSRVDARFVEFKRPPDCASFFNQYTLSRRRLPDLNATDSIPVRRRQQSTALEQSGFRQATVFDSTGVRLQARLLENMVRVGGEEGAQAAAAGAVQGASFLVDLPALRPNHYYCFQFISRRALSDDDLEALHVKFQQAVDEELRKDKYQEEREDYTTFKVGVEDYERLRVTLSAVIEDQLAKGSNQVVLAPPNSFFNVGAQLEDITARYREEFEGIAVKTVGARLVAIRNFDSQIGHAVTAMRRIAERTVGEGEEAKTAAQLVAESESEEVAEALRQLRNVGIDPTALLSISAEDLGERFKDLPGDVTLTDLKEVWDVDEIQKRIDNIQALTRALDSLDLLAKKRNIDLVAPQVNVTPVSEAQLKQWEQTVAKLKGFLETAKEKNKAEDGSALPDTPTITRLKTEIEEKEALLKRQREELDEGDFLPEVSLFYQANRFLGSAVGNLRQLQKLLQERSDDIGEWVRQVLVEEQASLVVGGTTVADYDTRAIWYMSADIGSGISDLEDFFTYVGWNIYLRPVNKKAHLSWAARPFGLKEEFMRRFSFTIGVVQSGFEEVEGEFEGVIGNNAAVLGAGFRINDSLRFSVGGLLFESQDPDPLIDSTRLSWSPYAAISLDWNIGASLSGLLPGR